MLILNQFWPAIRARNFVKALGEKPTNYNKNLNIIAERAGVDVQFIMLVNPLTFAERHFPTNAKTAMTLVGAYIYEFLDWCRRDPLHPCAIWEEECRKQEEEEYHYTQYMV